MTVGWLIKELQKANPRDECILIIDEVGGPECLRGSVCKVILSGEGARDGQCEIYAKD